MTEHPPSSPEHREVIAAEEAAVERETLLEFPCRFPLKIMGPATVAFEAAMRDLVHEVLGERANTVWQVRPSAKGNFIGLTVTFTAEHRAELDTLYRAITAHPDVKMCL
ncbi:YbeD family protein [Halothiobacillus sp. DCM-1]|uniref:YbeD family protein n=1 Tax=Halothiobacillus sp. DCM-1 TaxID=3112558 RepID=UPI00324BDB73